MPITFRKQQRVPPTLPQYSQQADETKIRQQHAATATTAGGGRLGHIVSLLLGSNNNNKACTPLPILESNNTRTRLAYLLDQLVFSERTRKIVWMATLVIIFLMERRRTILRSQRTASLVVTKVISGIILETPEDDASTGMSFVNITTGSHHVYKETKACDVKESVPCCRAHFPFVDLREFKSVYQRKRLKQVMPSSLWNDDSFALLTQRGIGTNHEDGNQDRAMLLHPFHSVESNDVMTTKRETINNDFLLVLADGHGAQGDHVAQAAMDNLPVSLTKELHTVMTTTGADITQVHQLMTQVMINTFNLIDQRVTSMTDNDNAAPVIDPASGTTMSVTLKLGDHLHIANVGDTQTFVVTYNAGLSDDDNGIVNILYATRPDKPDLPDERQRILANGGSLWLPPPTARGVQLPPSVYLEGLTDPVTNVTRDYVLALSRSIGDVAAHNTAGVVADPMVASLQISAFTDDDRQLFVFSASDGLLQKVAPLGIAERLAASLYRKDRSVSSLETIEGIILDANEAWSKSRSVENNELKDYRDDMTLAVAKILP